MSEKLEFEEVYTQYYQSVINFVYKRINNMEEAEELANVIFFAAYKGYDRYDPNKSQISTWLYTIVSNRLKNYYRDKSKRTIISLDSDDTFLDLEEEIDFDRAIQLEEDRKIVKETLAILSAREQRIITAKFFEEKNATQIGREMQLKSSYVRLIIYNALKKMRKYIESRHMKFD